jgi:hypothetical protein
MLLLLALLIGIVAGLRTMTAPAVVAWAAYLNWFDPGDGWLSLMSHWITPWVFTLLALAELVADQLPSTPSRTVPMQFGARILAGALTRSAHPEGRSSGGCLPALLAPSSVRWVAARSAASSPLLLAAIGQPPSWRMLSPSSAAF